ncbi:MAG TPA: aminotransferase class III-fold pyridoxal phosphate-dependent enzyme, partial [Gemmatimonadales bacterium]|nr:aminotransferase class III-fold pyridoxal phosphate-dependent enzyme [Gemmatimonadales bacterium]
AAIARSFDNGIEFFSTFGGSTLSCRVGTEVLRIVDEEGLQASAMAAGAKLLAGLRELQQRHPVIGDVRGIGLFVGVDLVTDRATRTPATRAARYVKNRLRQERILIGTEGPDDNVLKIRPPLTVDADDIEHLIERLDLVLSEAPASSLATAP